MRWMMRVAVVGMLLASCAQRRGAALRESTPGEFDAAGPGAPMGGGSSGAAGTARDGSADAAEASALAAGGRGAVDPPDRRSGAVDASVREAPNTEAGRLDGSRQSSVNMSEQDASDGASEPVRGGSPDAANDAGGARWTSECDGLEHADCDSRPACGWAPSPNLPFFAEGCYGRCPCASGAACEIALSDTDTCGQSLCLPDALLPTQCAVTIPCDGPAARVCWLQHPEPCGPCDSCVDENLGLICLVAPDGGRHWIGEPENGELLLEPGWGHCSPRPDPGDCGD